MEIICTYCSKKKDKNKNLLPAYKRYKGEHIKKVHQFAKKKDFPFFILSGKFGLVYCVCKIPDYDFLLEEQCVPLLVEVVKNQLAEHNITSISYYTESLKQNPRLDPYYDAIKFACKGNRVKFRKQPL